MHTKTTLADDRRGEERVPERGRGRDSCVVVVVQHAVQQVDKVIDGTVAPSRRKVLRSGVPPLLFSCLLRGTGLRSGSREVGDRTLSERRRLTRSRLA